MTPNPMLKRWLWWISAIVIAAVMVLHCLSAIYDHDEVEHLHSAWMISQGMRPYTDFMGQHHPTFWYLAAPLAGALGSPAVLIALFRLLNLAGLILLLFFVARIISRLFRGVDVRWPLLLLVAATMFFRKEIEVRADPWMNLFVFAGLWYWIRCVQDGGRRSALLAGILFGCSMVMLQKSALFLFLLVVASLLLILIHRGDRERVRALAKDIVLLFLGAVIPLALFFGAIVAAGLWGDFFFWCYTFNQYFYLANNVWGQFSALPVVLASLRDNGLLWLFGAAGLALVARGLLEKRRCFDGESAGRLLLFVVAIGFIPFFLRNRLPNPQYLIPWFPLMAIASSPVFLFAQGRRFGVVITLAVALMAVQMLWTLATAPSNLSQRAAQDFVLRQTAPSDPIFIPPPLHPIFRRDGAYFWYNGAMIGEAYAAFCAARRCPKDFLAIEERRWSEDPPRYVFLSPEPLWAPYRWEDHVKDYEEAQFKDLFRLKGSKARENN